MSAAINSALSVQSTPARAAATAPARPVAAAPAPAPAPAATLTLAQLVDGPAPFLQAPAVAGDTGTLSTRIPVMRQSVLYPTWTLFPAQVSGDYTNQTVTPAKWAWAWPTNGQDNVAILDARFGPWVNKDFNTIRWQFGPSPAGTTPGTDANVPVKALVMAKIAADLALVVAYARIAGYWLPVGRTTAPWNTSDAAFFSDLGGAVVTFVTAVVTGGAGAVFMEVGAGAAEQAQIFPAQDLALFKTALSVYQAA
jgi:hypothetical protein